MKGKLEVTVSDDRSSSHIGCNVSLEDVSLVDKVNLLHAVAKSVHLNPADESIPDGSDRFRAMKVTCGVAALCILTGKSYATLRKTLDGNDIMAMGEAMYECAEEFVSGGVDRKLKDILGFFS